jgi:hypothetical protein
MLSLYYERYFFSKNWFEEHLPAARRCFVCQPQQVFTKNPKNGGILTI